MATYYRVIVEVRNKDGLNNVLVENGIYGKTKADIVAERVKRNADDAGLEVLKVIIVPTKRIKHES